MKGSNKQPSYSETVSTIVSFIVGGLLMFFTITGIIAIITTLGLIL